MRTYLDFEIPRIPKNELLLAENGVNKSRRKVLDESLLALGQRSSLFWRPHCERRTNESAGAKLEDAFRDACAGTRLPRRSFSASVASVDQVSSSIIEHALAGD